MEQTETTDTKVGDFDTLRVRRPLKQRITLLQAAYYERRLRKINVNDLLSSALDAMDRRDGLAPASAPEGAELSQLRWLLEAKDLGPVETTWQRMIRFVLDEMTARNGNLQGRTN